MKCFLKYFIVTANPHCYKSWCQDSKAIMLMTLQPLLGLLNKIRNWVRGVLSSILRNTEHLQIFGPGMKSGSAKYLVPVKWSFVVPATNLCCFSLFPDCTIFCTSAHQTPTAYWQMIKQCTSEPQDTGWKLLLYHVQLWPRVIWET